MNPEYVRLICEYDAWATDRVIEACTALDSEQFNRDLGSSFPSVRATLVHLIGATRNWPDRWQGRTPQPSQLLQSDRYRDIESVRTLAAESRGRLEQFIGGMKPEDSERVVSCTLSGGQSIAQPFWQTLQHLGNHGTYHRGQITTLLRQLGATPASTDLSVYFREGRSKATVSPVTMRQIRLLYDYNAWANHRAIEAC